MVFKNSRGSSQRVASTRPRHLVSRRQFFQTLGGIGVSGLGTATYGYGVEAHHLVVEQVALPLRGLGARWHGKRIAQLTDLHANGEDSKKLLRRAFSMAVSCEPEMIVVTGDWVNDELVHMDDVRAGLAMVPGHIPVIGILGNHDYGFQQRWSAIDEELCGHLRNAGVRVLRNELYQPYAGAGELCIAGLEDCWTRRCDPTVLANTPKDGPTVVLSHNPDSFDLISQYRWDAVLCGHTHGGQVRIPGIGALRVPVYHTEWAEGLIRPDKSGRLMYVSRGVGHWFRIRLFCPPEVTCLTLQPV